MIEDDRGVDYTRQRDIFDPESHELAQVTLVGCGGIGSATALALSKLGIPNMTFIDFDEVERHNIPNQMFPLGSEDNKKVKALAELCKTFGGDINIIAYDGRVEDVPKQLLRGVLVTGLDSMEARSNVWDLAKNNVNIELLVDGRLGKEDIVIYSVNPCDQDDIEYYEAIALGYTDEEAEELACTEKAVIDVMFQVASLITRIVRRHYVNDNVERVIALNQGSLTMEKG